MPFETEPNTESTIEVIVIKNPDGSYSSEFLEWFGDSVITESGQAGGAPKAVYHGTDSQILKIDASIGQIGMHFGSRVAATERITTKQEADATTLSVYVKMCRPLRLQDDVHNTSALTANQFGTWEHIRRVLLDEHSIAVDEDLFKEHYIKATTIEKRDDPESNVALQHFLEFYGFDGIIYENVVEDRGRDSIIVFKNTPLISAETGEVLQ